uniref:protein-glutamine gamma-glutamyltransferase n=1 Tax=Culicoides sonorensis TaxID=179676 RepID=A0A336LKB0_CULSO
MGNQISSCKNQKISRCCTESSDDETSASDSDACCECSNSCFNCRKLNRKSNVEVTTRIEKGELNGEETAEVREVSQSLRTSPSRAPSVEIIDAPAPDVLTIKLVDLCISQNGTDHHTDRYDLMRRHERLCKLVVRRGQAFHLKLQCNRPYIHGKDAISLIFTVADEEKPSHGAGTLVGIALKDSCSELDGDVEWCAGIEKITGDIIEIHIKAGITAPVTKWKLDIDTKLFEGGSKTYSLPQPFYLLFNPWCKWDQVYMPKTHNLSEYVLSEGTLVFRGTYNRIRPVPWHLGQFQRDILDCAMLVISQIANVSSGNRGDPVKVARALSAAVNYNDDNGIVVGSWEDKYPDGISPTKWTSSVEIMQKYWKKRKPVKYGQCWIFAGVLATAARALGLPSRIVTNYNSAHDRHASLTVDVFVDEDGNRISLDRDDSVWNYHVWTEVWMDRPDLEVGPMGGYGGWQAVDATPQEQSDNQYRCGPASVLAVKLGEIQKPYDHNFLYAEVNADKVYWLYSGPTQPLKLLKKDTYAIGHFISTKAVGEYRREDITNSYKYSEKSTEERDVFLKALRKTSHQFSRYYLNEEFNEVSFDFELRDDIKIGESFSVILRIKNRSLETTHEVSGGLTVETVTYTGKMNDRVKALKFLEEIEPKSTKLVKLDVSFDEYYHKLLPQSAFEISCFVKVRGTDYDYYATDDFRVRKPDIKISFEGDPPISQTPVTVVVRLLNPLPLPLHKGVFHIEAPGFEKPLILKMPEIPVKAMAEGKFDIIPPWSGRHTIFAKFDSKELDDVDGFLNFEAAPQPEDVLLPENNHDIIARTDVIA